MNQEKKSSAEQADFDRAIEDILALIAKWKKEGVGAKDFIFAGILIFTEALFRSYPNDQAFIIIFEAVKEALRESSQ